MKAWGTNSGGKGERNVEHMVAYLCGHYEQHYCLKNRNRVLAVVVAGAAIDYYIVFISF